MNSEPKQIRRGRAKGDTIHACKKVYDLQGGGFLKKKKNRNRIQKLIFSRFIVTAFFLILQIVLLSAIYGWLKNYNHVTLTIMTTLSIILGVFLLNGRENPAYKAEWILLIAIFPVFGTFLYFYIRLNIGTTMPKKLLGEIITETKPYAVSETETRKQLGASELRIGRLATYLEDVGGYPAYAGDEVTYYSLGDHIAKPIMEALESAKKFIFLEFFIIKEGHFWDSVLEVLERKAAEGVEVRLLYDGMGCLGTIPEDYYNILRQKGINARAYAEIRPFLSTAYNNRDHRKVLVVDNTVAFTGGFNLADEYTNEETCFGHWKDTGVRVEGKAVNSFTMMFLQMWNSVFVQYRAPELYQNYMYRPNTESVGKAVAEVSGEQAEQEDTAKPQEEENDKELVMQELSAGQGAASAKAMAEQLEKVDTILAKVLPEQEEKESSQKVLTEQEDEDVGQCRTALAAQEAAEKSENMQSDEKKQGSFVIPYGDGPHQQEEVAENVYIDIISHARRYVYIMTPYLMMTDEMKRCICYAAKSGVDVGIVVPHIPDKKGIFAVTRSNYPELLEASVKMYEYTPGFVHAKMIVADDEIAVVGTINFDFRSLFLHYECGALFYQHPVISDIKKDFDETMEQSQCMSREDYNRISPFKRLEGWILRIIAPIL